MTDGISQEAMEMNIERSDGVGTNNNDDVDKDDIDSSQISSRLMITKMVSITVLMSTIRNFTSILIILLQTSSFY